MEFTIYYINFKNYELDDIQVQIKRLQSEPETTLLPLQGAEVPALLETIEQDDDKTKSVRGRRLTIGFNSTDSLVYSNAETFAEDDLDFQGKIITDSGAIPFLGNIVKNDISEAFQPKPNVVLLKAGDGFGALKQIELTESDGDIPRGHFRLIDYITLCLRHINFDELPIYIAFNLYEQDTDPVTSNAFFDQFLDALTFETDPNKRDDCFTVLEKILDALGCFITFDNSRYYIIRWDEWDNTAGDITTLRFAEFTFEGVFVTYHTIDVDKNIAGIQTADYDGYFLSNDSAQKRFQTKAQFVRHIYKFEQPKEVPCNSHFLNGTVDDDVLPLKTYIPDCWTLKNGVPGSYGTTTSEMRIGVRFDANDYETERFLYLTPTTTSQLFEYAESEAIDVKAKGKLEASVNWRTESLYPSAYGGLYSRMVIYLRGNDGSDWLLGNTDLTDVSTPLKWWDTSNFTVATSAGHIDLDSTLIEETEWQSQTIEESPEIPVDGKIYIWLYQGNQSGATSDDDSIAIDYSELKFTYFAYINGTYHTITSQQHEVTGNQTNIIIEKEMFISDSPEPIFKGALKKFDGSNYILTEGWNNYLDPTILPGERLAKHIVFQWWNQFRTTRTVIESDVQGLTENIPSQINRWFIKHADEGDKYFMLTSFTGMNFATGGWHGVFVETSNGAGNRIYSDQWNFKYLQT